MPVRWWPALATLAAFVAASPATVAVPAASGAGSPAQFAVAPVAAIVGPRFTGGGYQIVVAIRTRHALPRTKTGSVYAALTVNKAAADEGVPRVATIDKKHNCYTAQVLDTFGQAEELDHPRVGQLVTVRLVVQDSLVLSRRVRLIADPTTSKTRPAPVSAYLRLLGCESRIVPSGSAQES